MASQIQSGLGLNVVNSFSPLGVRRHQVSECIRIEIQHEAEEERSWPPGCAT